jgi:hypothetical protein
MSVPPAPDAVYPHAKRNNGVRHRCFAYGGVATYVSSTHLIQAASNCE